MPWLSVLCSLRGQHTSSISKVWKPCYLWLILLFMSSYIKTATKSSQFYQSSVLKTHHVFTIPFLNPTFRPGNQGLRLGSHVAGGSTLAFLWTQILPKDGKLQRPRKFSHTKVTHPILDHEEGFQDPRLACPSDSKSNFLGCPPKDRLHNWHGLLEEGMHVEHDLGCPCAQQTLCGRDGSWG